MPRTILLLLLVVEVLPLWDARGTAAAAGGSSVSLISASVPSSRVLVESCVCRVGGFGVEKNQPRP